ncbi:MAG: hypothetical protein EOO02_21520 [Chitinophagaceae bacterium]|nr:MAG: hypothetical protein EOO02_21520 [Chitinophagaceae bacterium]
MKNLLTLLLVLVGFTASAQQYNNEWIQFNQTYYRFKVANTGLYRLPKAALTAAGIGETPVQFLELWNNGKMVPFYPSVPNGVLPAGGYLEFWAEHNDGKTDKGLYRLPAYQHSDKVSLLTDTAAYFLSINTSGTGFRHTDVVNDPDASVLPVEQFFTHTTGAYFTNMLNPGFAAVVGEYVFSSSYDKGEFWSSFPITPSGPLNHALSGLQVYASGSPQSFFKFGAVGNALNSRTIGVRLNSSSIKDTVMDFFNDINTSIPIPTSLIASGTATVQFTNNSAVTTDR